MQVARADNTAWPVGAAAGQQVAGGMHSTAARSVSLMLLHSRPHCCSSRECQQADWKAGHKHACKKLRKQRQAEARRAAAGDADGSSGEAAEGGAVASEAKDGGSKERPEESNSTPPLPKQASVCLLWGCHSLPPILSACCTLAGAITPPCHAPTNWCCCCRPTPAQVLYPSERYAELAAAPPQRKAPIGLANVGNSCYANSLLQSLMATPSLAAFLVSGGYCYVTLLLLCGRRSAWLQPCGSCCLHCCLCCA